jgi:nicotinate-nucleotide adenylyltransferase
MFGVFGGTFDPVHIGHLEMARFVKQKLELDEMWMVLSAQPPHRSKPVASPEQRLAMLEIAIRSYPELTIDDIELKRSGPSYTVLTMMDMRNRVGATTSLCCCLGMDAFCDLENWYQWRSLFDLANIVVVTRPGFSRVVSPALSRELANRQVQHPEDLRQSPFGGITILESPEIGISARRIREIVQTEPEEAEKWLAPGVLNYIQQNRLYPEYAE